MEEEKINKQKEYEDWNLNKDEDRPTRTLEQMIEENEKERQNQGNEEEDERRKEEEAEEEEEEIAELIERQFARPEKDEFDCESICSTYSNLLNHPTLIG